MNITHSMKKNKRVLTMYIKHLADNANSIAITRNKILCYLISLFS